MPERTKATRVVDVSAFPDETDCPFPGCSLEAEHNGDHDVSADGTAVEAYADDDGPGSATAAIAEAERLTSDAPQPPPQPITRRKHRKPPANLDEPVLVIPCRLRNVSVGKSIANVTATLTFAVDSPADVREYLGEHAYAVVFGLDYIGNGVQLKDAPLSVDVENNVNQSLKLQLPRWADGGVDQVKEFIAPLLPDPEALNDELLGLSSPWRLNIKVDIEGQLRLHQMQQSFDLTKRAE